MSFKEGDVVRLKGSYTIMVIVELNEEQVVLEWWHDKSEEFWTITTNITNIVRV